MLGWVMAPGFSGEDAQSMLGFLPGVQYCPPPSVSWWQLHTADSASKLMEPMMCGPYVGMGHGTWFIRGGCTMYAWNSSSLWLQLHQRPLHEFVRWVLTFFRLTRKKTLFSKNLFFFQALKWPNCISSMSSPCILMPRLLFAADCCTRLYSS